MAMSVFFTRFLQGHLGLARTFWGFWVLANALFSLLSDFFQTFAARIGFQTFTALYTVVVLIAIWNAAKHYEGRPAWANLARGVVVLGALGVVVQCYLLGSLVLRGAAGA